MASTSSNVVGVHYRVGKKIGEGSFGVIFEGTNLLNNQQIAIKFVSVYFYMCILSQPSIWLPWDAPSFNTAGGNRNLGRATHHNCVMSTARTRSSLAAVSQIPHPPPTLAMLTPDSHKSRHSQCLLLRPRRAS